MTAIPDFITAAVEARTESTGVDFKGSFDPANKGEWIEVIKDVAALANTGRGVLLFGVDNEGNATGLDCRPIIDFDIARIGDKVRKYTGTNISDLALFACERDGCEIAALSVGPVEVPLVFITDGQYTNAAGDERFAFRAGTIYFRHGAKSEPGTSDDLRQFLERRVAVIRESWLVGIRQVVEAPEGAEFRVVAPGTIERAADVKKVRVVAAEEEATPCITLHPDQTHPYRQCDVVRIVNFRLGRRAQINPHDVLSVRRTHETDDRAEFFYQGKYSSAQYSDAFLDWMVRSFEEDSAFFEKARAEYHNVLISLNARSRRLRSQRQDARSLGI